VLSICITRLTRWGVKVKDIRCSATLSTFGFGFRPKVKLRPLAAGTIHSNSCCLQLDLQFIAQQRVAVGLGNGYFISIRQLSYDAAMLPLPPLLLLCIGKLMIRN